MRHLITWLWITAILFALRSAPLSADEARVLSIEANDCCVPLLQGILIDPLIASEIPANEKALKRLADQIDSDKKALPTAKNKAFLTKRIVDALAVEAAYWQLKDNGTKLYDKQAREKAQGALLAFAPLAIRSLQTKEQKQSVLFTVILTQYLVNPKKASESLAGIQVTNVPQADMLEFLKGVDQADKGSTEGLRNLENHAARISKQASIVAALVKAKALSHTKSSYRSELLYASRLCQDLPLSDREKILRFNLGVWTKSIDFNNQWEPVPFQVSCFEETKGFPALLENLAINSRNQGRLDKAIAYFTDAINRTALESQKADLSTKLAEAHRLAFQRDAKRDTYQDYLVLAEGRFHSLPEGIRFLQMHDELIRGEIAKQFKLAPKPENLLDVRGVYDRYIAAAAFSPESRKIRSEWVGLLERHKQFDEAVDGLLSLSKGTTGIVREKYLRHALALQTSSLNVNLDKPWVFPDVKDTRQLARLASIMDLLAPFHKGQLAFQLSRTRISEKLGLTDDARARFRVLLPTAPNANDRNQIFTSLLFAALTVRDYLDVEQLIELSTKMAYKSTQALPENKTMKALYIDTIVYEINDSFAHNKWPASRMKMDKILSFLPDAPQRSEILYLKARAFQNEKRFNDALTALDEIQGSKVLDQTWKQAILDKAALQLAQGNMEAAVISYELYLAKAPGEDREIDVRKSLVDLYLGLDNLAKARQGMLRLLKSEDIDGDQQVLLSEKLVALHKRLGRDEELRADIAFFQKQGFENRSALAQMLNIYIRRNPGIPQSEKFFAESDKTLGAVGDYLSESAFSLAKLYSVSKFAKVQDSYKAATEPSPEILRTSYDSVVKAFMRACDVPSASHCAPALSELSFEAKRYAKWLDQSIGGKSTDKTRELKAYFEKEQIAVGKQLDDAIASGNNKANWLNAFSRDKPDMWRFIGLGSQTGVSRLDIPQALPAQNSLEFTQGVN